MKLKTKGYKKYHYFYKITNLINNNFYYGIHSTDVLNDGYMGSGKRLKAAYKKYGIENFKKDILVFFNSRKDAVDYESKMVTESLVKDVNCYNIVLGGEFINSLNLVTIYDSSTDTYEDIPIDEYRNNKSRYKTHSSGKVSCIRIEDNSHVMISTEEFHNNPEKYQGYLKSKVLCKDENGNTVCVDKNDPDYINGKLKCIWSGKKHNKESIEKMKNTYKNNNHQQKEKNSQWGTCWVYNDYTSKKIKRDQLDDYLSHGWLKGRKMKFK